MRGSTAASRLDLLAVLAGVGSRSMKLAIEVILTFGMFAAWFAVLTHLPEVATSCPEQPDRSESSRAAASQVRAGTANCLGVPGERRRAVRSRQDS